MLFVRPRSIGYTAVTPFEDSILENKDHQMLFDFVEMDLSEFKTVFLAYFNTRVDTETGACIKEKGSPAQVKKLKKAARRVHPLLENDSYLDGLSSMLLDFYNILLFHNSIENMDEDEYMKAAMHLTDPIVLSETARGRIRPRTELISTQYEIYKEKKLKNVMGGYEHLYRIQAQVKRWLYWILDASSSRFGKLSTEERCRLYRQVFNIDDIRTDFSFTERFAWSMGNRKILSMESFAENPEDILKWRERAEEKKEYADIFKELDDDSLDIDSELQEYLQKEIQKAQNSNRPALYREYEIRSFAQLISLEIRLMVDEPVIVKRCRHCARYFLTDKSTIEYCSRTPEGEDSPCDVTGPKMSFSRLLEEDAALKAYNATYKTYYARQRRGTITEEEFSAWRDEAKQRLQDTREGKISLEAYKSWLKQDIRKWTTS